MTTENPQAPESATAPENPPAPATPSGRFRMSGKKWLVLGLAIVVLAGVGVGTWFLLKPKTSTAASSSRTVQVTKGTQTMSVAFDGTLSPRKQSNVNFSVSGTVTSVKVKAGQTVKKGQKLAAVDDSDLAGRRRPGQGQPDHRTRPTSPTCTTTTAAAQRSPLPRRR